MSNVRKGLESSTNPKNGEAFSTIRANFNDVQHSAEGMYHSDTVNIRLLKQGKPTNDELSTRLKTTWGEEPLVVGSFFGHSFCQGEAMSVLHVFSLNKESV